MTKELYYSSINELNELYINKKTSPTEVTKVFLERIKKHDSDLNSFINVYENDAIEDAKEAEKYISNKNENKLIGIPIGLKDLVDVKGKITTAGSKILEGNIADKNAKITEDFINSKSVILGKTNLVEFAFGTLGINTTTKTCRNPWNMAKVPGGSSSGSAVSVSSGLTTFAIGTDTGGSVRMPASLCGITGFKPTYGAVSRVGVKDLSWTMDHVGPMARSAEDCLEVMKVISGHDARDKYSIDLSKDRFNIEKSIDREKIKIGIPKQYFFDDVDSQILNRVNKSIEILKDLGYKLVEVDLPFVSSGRNINVGVLIPEAISIHRQFLKKSELYTKTVINRLLGGIGVTADEYLDASRAMSAFNYQMSEKMKDIDALLTPTVPVIAPNIEDSYDPNTLEANSMGRFTGVFNLTGQPSISIPCGLTNENLPVGLMISGKLKEDNKILNIAIDFQNNTDFNNSIPKF